MRTDGEFVRAALTILLLLASALGQSQNVTSEQRFALVIGNSTYKESPLRNPANDATDMAQALRGLGFRVTLHTNVTHKQMTDAVRQFGQDIRKGGVALFYFAGHGVQSKGRNYLVPVGSTIESEADLEFESTDVYRILSQMEEAGTRINVVILDACRNNPFARKFRSAARGLAQLEAAKGTLLAYATAPGEVAFDGEGRNGTYTKHLLASLRQPDTEIERVFKRVRQAVVKETGNKQVPWESSSLIGDFSFQYGSSPPTTASIPAAAASGTIDSSANERVFWESVKDSKNADEVRAYLEKYPEGLFSSLARARLRSLESVRVAKVTAASAQPLSNTPLDLFLRSHIGKWSTVSCSDPTGAFMVAAREGDGITVKYYQSADHTPSSSRVLFASVRYLGQVGEMHRFSYRTEPLVGNPQNPLTLVIDTDGSRKRQTFSSTQPDGTALVENGVILSAGRAPKPFYKCTED